MACLAGAAVAGSAFLFGLRWFPEQAWPGLAVALLAGLALGAAAIRHFRPRATPYRAVAVDGDGAWLLADAGGAWRGFVPARAWHSPAWITLEGQVESASAPASLTIWFDAVPASDWRKLRAALVWTERRGLEPSA